MLEKEMRKILKNKLKSNNVSVHPIESHGTELGIPDLMIRTLNMDVWVELKRIDNYKYKGTLRVPFRPGQLKWVKNYRNLNGNVKLILTINKEWYLFKEIKETYTNKELNELSLIPKNIHCISIKELINILEY